MEYPLNDIAGMTFDRLMDRMLVNFPKAELHEDSDGNLVIHLNQYLSNGIVTAFTDDDED